MYPFTPTSPQTENPSEGQIFSAPSIPPASPTTSIGRSATVTPPVRIKQALTRTQEATTNKFPITQINAIHEVSPQNVNTKPSTPSSFLDIGLHPVPQETQEHQILAETHHAAIKQVPTIPQTSNNEITSIRPAIAALNQNNQMAAITPIAQHEVAFQKDKVTANEVCTVHIMSEEECAQLRRKSYKAIETTKVVEDFLNRRQEIIKEISATIKRLKKQKKEWIINVILTKEIERAIETSKTLKADIKNSKKIATIEVLTNLSKRVAEWFEKIKPFINNLEGLKS